MPNPEGIKGLFLEAPESQIDLSVKPLIEAWDDPPTTLQMLRVLDEMARYAAGSEFSIMALDLMLQDALKDEGQTYEQLVAQATWRV